MTVISLPDPSLQVALPPADADAAEARIASVSPGIAHERSHRSGGWGWLLLLAPMLCYGLPLLTAAVTGIGASTLGLAAGIPLALVAVLTVGLGLRRRKIAAAHCCPVEATGRRR